MVPGQKMWAMTRASVRGKGSPKTPEPPQGAAEPFDDEDDDEDDDDEDEDDYEGESRCRAPTKNDMSLTAARRTRPFFA